MLLTSVSALSLPHSLAAVGAGAPPSSNTRCSQTCTVSNGTYTCTGCTSECGPPCIGGICAGTIAVFAIVVGGVCRHHARRRHLAEHHLAAQHNAERTLSMNFVASQHHLKHCGRPLGRPTPPGSDGRCSLMNGQCPTCMHEQAALAASESAAAVAAAFAVAFPHHHGSHAPHIHDLPGSRAASPSREHVLHFNIERNIRGNAERTASPARETAHQSAAKSTKLPSHDHHAPA